MCFIFIRYKRYESFGTNNAMTMWLQKPFGFRSTLFLSSLYRACIISTHYMPSFFSLTLNLKDFDGMHHFLYIRSHTKAANQQDMFFVCASKKQDCNVDFIRPCGHNYFLHFAMVKFGAYQCCQAYSCTGIPK